MLGLVGGGGGAAGVGALVGAGSDLEGEFAFDVLGTIVVPGIDDFGERVNFADEGFDLAGINLIGKFFQCGGAGLSDQHDGFDAILFGFLLGRRLDDGDEDAARLHDTEGTQLDVASDGI